MPNIGGNEVLNPPFVNEFKLSVSYQLPWQVQISAAFQSYAGSMLPTRWSIGRTTRYAANCVGPCTPGALVIPNMTATTYVLDVFDCANGCDTAQGTPGDYNLTVTIN